MRSAQTIGFLREGDKEACNPLRLLFKGAQVYQGGKFRLADVLTDGKCILSVESQIDPTPEYDIIPCEGLHLIPGLVDVHVHLREPGFSYKESILTGTRAAARGGYTLICSMPNLKPAPDCFETLNVQIELLKRDARVRVVPYGTITRERKGEALSRMAEMADYVIGFTDDGSGVDDDRLMRQAMALANSFDKPIVAHCEDSALSAGGYINHGLYAIANGHAGISGKSEWSQLERDLRLVRSMRCRYHACHLSTRESVGLVRRAKLRGQDVTCEVAPHHLLLDDSLLKEDGRFKMNPPIRTVADRQALYEGLLDGTVDMIATDHAPHAEKEKNVGLRHSAMGVVGLETAFPLLYTYLVRQKLITLEKLVELMSIRPREVFSLPSGEISQGQAADFALFDLNATYAIDPAEFHSMGKSTPFEGWSVCGRNVMTLVDGAVAFIDDDFKSRAGLTLTAE